MLRFCGICGLPYVGLIVVLQGHGDDVDADDEGDDEVQVVVGAQCVDHQPDFAVAAVVGQLLGFWQWKEDIALKLIVIKVIRTSEKQLRTRMFLLRLPPSPKPLESKVATHSFQ